MLKYIATQGQYIADIPARDLTDEEVALYGKKMLLDSGLYAESEMPRVRLGKNITEAQDDNRRN